MAEVTTALAWLSMKAFHSYYHDSPETFFVSMAKVSSATAQRIFTYRGPNR